ncbi:HD domain-containing protein [Kitasatospora sp. NPDC096147]|uniref:HD domain-containing protein n=1 Tax=Kitasatospora sp. NPDC096147 TaxID=3364093 RepID=UPI00380AE40B
MLTLDEIDALAEQAHAGQVDKLGVPYVGHVRAVAAGLAPFGAGLQMAGLLHDVLEDTELTAEDLLRAGVPGAVVATVQRVTRVAGVGYEEMIRQVAGDQAAALVKIADNAHNSHPDRTAGLAPASRDRLALRYRGAREVLWPAVPVADVRAVLELVNPHLLAELAATG